MIKKPNTNAQRLKRHKRVRAKISGTAERPRLNVFRSEKNIYAQVIDDVNGVTLCSASSLKLEGNGGNKAAARATLPLPSPTTIRAENFITRPPLTVLLTRLRWTTFSIYSLWGFSNLPAIFSLLP